MARLSVVLALLLAVQWGMAFAQCLAPLGRGPVHSLEICTGEGMRTLALDEDGRPAAPAGVHDHCPLCPGSAAPAPEPPRLPAARVRFDRPAPPCPAGLPPAPARAPPQQPRAPPIA